MVRQANRRTTADIMTASSSRSSQPVGFLTVCEHEAQGVFGGYLILNTAGRPLEFHCTAPVRPSRAQEILYGATLQAYLYGEQIGQALLEKAKTTPLVVFTDAPAVLTVRGFTSLPVACVMTPAWNRPPKPIAARRLGRCDWTKAAPDRRRRSLCVCTRFTLAATRWRSCRTTRRMPKSSPSAGNRWQPTLICGSRFGRIREAVDEARRSATR